MAARHRTPLGVGMLSLGLGLSLGLPAVAEPPLEVEVVNDSAAPVPVSVEQVVEVYVDNDASEPIPVEVTSTPPEVPILILLYEWDYTHSGDSLRIEEVHEICVGVQPDCFSHSGAYYVPDDKVLVIESVSFSVSTPTSNAGRMAANIAIQPPGGGEFAFAAGLADFVHPQSKTWQTNFTGTLRAGAGSKVRGGAFWDQNVDRLNGGMSISGVLVHAPGSESGTGNTAVQAGPASTGVSSLSSRAGSSGWRSQAAANGVEDPRTAVGSLPTSR